MGAADLDPAAFRAPEGYDRIDIRAALNVFDRLLNGARDAPSASNGRRTP